MAHKIPKHPEGWKFRGGAGQHYVWHAGKNDYRVTDPHGTVVRTEDQFNPAFLHACRLHDMSKRTGHRPGATPGLSEEPT